MRGWINVARPVSGRAVFNLQIRLFRNAEEAYASLAVVLMWRQRDACDRDKGRSETDRPTLRLLPRIKIFELIIEVFVNAVFEQTLAFVFGVLVFGFVVRIPVVFFIFDIIADRSRTT